jgi:hypothetical protein
MEPDHPNDWQGWVVILGITGFPLWFPGLLIFIQWLNRT